MLFCSIEFIFLFLPVFLLIYYGLPRKYSNIVLFAGSLFFYWYGEHKYFILILVSLAIHYALTRFSYGRSVRVRRACLALMLLYGFGTLFLFKYLVFFADNWNALAGHAAAAGAGRLPRLDVPQLTLPLGISFYTFQIASYAIDVYRGGIEPEKKFINLGAYLTMFPQLIAGPIVLYRQVAGSLDKRKLSAAHLENGLKTFIIGLSMKMLLANPFGSLWNQVLTWGVDSVSVPVAWLGVLAYTFQIYFDFSGYSVMAMGLGEMLGFKIPRNFRHPYISCSVTEFWRRWHITLSSWFRDYIYIPLGGSRRGKGRMVLNMFIVWGLTGFWHGASWNFVIWGLYYFVILTVEKLFLSRLLDKSKVLGWIWTFFLVSVGWAIFAIDDSHILLAYLHRMFGCLGQAQAWMPRNGIFTQVMKDYGVYFILGFFFSIPFPLRIYNVNKKKPVMILALAVLFGLCVYKLATAASNPFLYFRF